MISVWKVNGEPGRCLAVVVESDYRVAKVSAAHDEEEKASVSPENEMDMTLEANGVHATGHCEAMHETR
jgi:hypothetical protein